MILKILKNKVDLSILFVVCIGLTLSVSAFFYVKQWEYERFIHTQQRQIDGYVRALQKDFVAFKQILYSLQGLFNVSDDINQEDFNLFITPYLHDYPTIYAVEWIKSVTPKTIDSPIDMWHYSKTGEPEPIAVSQQHYPITFIAPFEQRKNQRGFDLNSEKSFSTLFQQANHYAHITASEATPITTHRGKQLGFRLILPVYRHYIPESLQGRQLRGFISITFIVKELIHQVLRSPRQSKENFLLLIDKTQNTANPYLYAPSWYNRIKEDASQNVQLLLSAPLDFGQRPWQFDLYQANYHFYIRHIYAWTVLLIGIILTFGTLRYMQLILFRAKWAEELVASRTNSLAKANETLNQEVLARQKTTEALEISRQHFKTIFNEAAMGIAQLDLEGHILDSNKALQHLLGYSPTELQATYIHDLVHPADRNKDHALLQALLAEKQASYTITKRYLRRGQHSLWINQNSSIVRNNQQTFIISMFEDITENRLAEQARRAAEQKYRDIFEHSIEGIFQSTLNGQYLNVNPAFVRIFDYDNAEQIYSEVVDVAKQIYVDPEKRKEFLNLLDINSKVQSFEYQAYCRDKRIIWVSETARAVRDDTGEIHFYEGMIEDITQRKLTENKLRYDASHDKLTGLLNRNALTEHLNQLLAHHSSHPEIHFSLLFLDLDRFKIVNDSLGHWMGDKLLIDVAQRLTKHSYNKDILARFGGDEFALIIHHIDNNELEQRVKTIQQLLTEPYVLGDEVFKTTASIGVALSSNNYKNADEMLRDVDTAMYEAKKQNGGKFVIFQQGMHTNVINILRMESDLRSALDNNEFCLYYQPIISLSEWKTVGLEALVRWEHPERGLIMPDEFIPLAEETGLIHELGLWVFEEACSQLQQWRGKFSQYSNLGMNINVSPIQLKHSNIVQQIEEILHQTQIKAGACRLEITENAIMQNPDLVINLLNDLKALEVLLYIDDFGTGYSSLSYLSRFPIDALKIDKGFIKEINAPGKPAQIAEAIIALGAAFDLKIVAEGVENNTQLSILHAAHCHHVQGFLFSRPQSAQDIEVYLDKSVFTLEENRLIYQ